VGPPLFGLSGMDKTGFSSTPVSSVPCCSFWPPWFVRMAFRPALLTCYDCSSFFSPTCHLKSSPNRPPFSLFFRYGISRFILTDGPVASRVLQKLEFSPLGFQWLPGFPGCFSSNISHLLVGEIPPGTKLFRRHLFSWKLAKKAALWGLGLLLSQRAWLFFSL